jgi:DNA-binding CsgD family transcriptional regulator
VNIHNQTTREKTLNYMEVAISDNYVSDYTKKRLEDKFIRLIENPRNVDGSLLSNQTTINYDVCNSNGNFYLFKITNKCFNSVDIESFYFKKEKVFSLGKTTFFHSDDRDYGIISDIVFSGFSNKEKEIIMYYALGIHLLEITDKTINLKLLKYLEKRFRLKNKTIVEIYNQFEIKSAKEYGDYCKIRNENLLKLNPKEKEVLQFIIENNAYDDISLRDIAVHYHISVKSVNQLYEKLRTKSLLEWQNKYQIKNGKI